MSIDKKLLRQQLLCQRRALDSKDIAIRSKLIANFFCSSALYHSASTIMAFLSMPDEPQMEAIIRQSWADGKNICIPFLHTDRGFMDAALISGFEQLTCGRLGLLLPDVNKTLLVAPGLIDLILVPAVAYDYSGNRLGMGSGYYDRYLPRARNAVLVGVNWSENVLPHIPTGEHDYPVSYVVTDKGMKACDSGKM